jgi:hypothetical protein
MSWMWRWRMSADMLNTVCKMLPYCVRTSTHRYWQTKWSWPWFESQRHWNMNKSKTKLDIGNGLDTKQFTWELRATELLQKSCSRAHFDISNFKIRQLLIWANFSKLHLSPTFYNTKYPIWSTLSGPPFLRFRSHLFNRFIWVTNDHLHKMSSKSAHFSVLVSIAMAMVSQTLKYVQVPEFRSGEISHL